MNAWPNNPVLYEINTWVWLQELSRQTGKKLTLAKVPAAIWDAIAELKVDAVWLMGVWERSPKGIAIANNNQGLLEDFRRALPDFQPEDNVGSPYCVRQYAVDKGLGGREGLAIARKELAQRGIRLILDFVPNHIAPDHPWVKQHPEYFIQGSIEDAQRDPASFVEILGKVFACGKDPNYPAWPDVLQLNGFHPGLRRAVIDTLTDIAGQCDGLRCDMAMLLINSIFERTWGPRAGQRPAAEYWIEVISAIRSTHPNFLFMAEAYWDLEWELQQQGFDFCYDKTLYDRLEHNHAESVRLHLCADLAYQQKLVRFIENHDEPRARASLSSPKDRAAAVVMATIPGAKLFHEGQFEGRKTRIPVFLGRRPVEPPDPDLPAFYRTLLEVAALEEMRGGFWQLCDRTGWPGNGNYQHLVAWCWRNAGRYWLIIVNLSDSGAQGRVLFPWLEARGKAWNWTDLFTSMVYERSGDEMCAEGLYVDLPAWGFHVWATEKKRGKTDGVKKRKRPGGRNAPA